MSHLVPCPGCARHVRHLEAACPFCGVALALAQTPPPELPRIRLGRAATFAFGATLVSATALVACGGDSESGKEGGGGMSSGGSNGGGSNAGTGTGGGPVYGAPAAGMGGNIAQPYGVPPIGGSVPIYGAPTAGMSQGGSAGDGGSAGSANAGSANAGSGGTLGPAPAYGLPPVPEQ